MAKQSNTGKPASATTTPSPSRAVAAIGKPIGSVNMFAPKKPLLKPEVSACNYVQFLNSKSGKYADVLGSLGIKPKDWVADTPVLHTVTGPVLLSPFRYFLTTQFFQHFSEFDDRYEILSSMMDIDEKPGREFTECVEALIVVVVPPGGSHKAERYFPAHMNFRGTKAAAFHTLNTHINERMEEASETGCYQDFFGEFTLTEYTSKASRREMTIGDCVVNPAGAAQKAALNKAFTDKNFMTDMGKCIESMKNRHAAVTAKLVN